MDHHSAVMRTILALISPMMFMGALSSQNQKKVGQTCTHYASESQSSWRCSSHLLFSGHQRNALFRNNGDGTFTEVGFLEGADRIEDGYIIVR